MQSGRTKTFCCQIYCRGHKRYFNPADRFAAQLDEINDKLTTLVNKKGVEYGQ